MTVHTNFQQGQLVFVQLRNGVAFVDRFLERRSKAIVLSNRGRVPIGQLRAVSIKREQRS